MNDSAKTYLTVRNILFILLAWIGVACVYPSANSWTYDSGATVHHSLLFATIELVFVMFYFSYKALIDKEYKKVLLLSVVGAVIWSISYFLNSFFEVNRLLISFICPPTLSLAVIFVVERKFKLALCGYVIGYLFSFLPLIAALIPILFLQLWFGSLSMPVAGSKFARFLSRALIYYLIMFVWGILYFELYSPYNGFSHGVLPKSVCISIAIFIIGLLYFMLNKYLIDYYSHYNSKVLKVLSYIPVLWCIPLIEIFVKCDKNDKLNSKCYGEK